MMPPSPSLFCRMMSSKYLMDTTMISDQSTKDRMPMTLAGVAGSEFTPKKH